jgi:hypothetical protein
MGTFLTSIGAGSNAGRSAAQKPTRSVALKDNKILTTVSSESRQVLNITKTAQHINSTESQPEEPEEQQ